MAILAGIIVNGNRILIEVVEVAEVRHRRSVGSGHHTPYWYSIKLGYWVCQRSARWPAAFNNPLAQRGPLTLLPRSSATACLMDRQRRHTPTA